MVLVIGSVPDAADVLSGSGGLVVSYRTLADARLGCPAGQVQAVVLACEMTCDGVGKALEWVRQRWPRCSSVVIGDAGDAQREIAARSGGAMYFAKPVERAQWNMLAEHVLKGPASKPTRMG